MQILKKIETPKQEEFAMAMPSCIESLDDIQIVQNKDYSSKAEVAVWHGEFDQPIAAFGDIMVISGREGTRKSFMIKSLVASTRVSIPDHNLGFKGQIPDDKWILSFDTEMTKQRVQKLDEKLFKMTNNGNPIPNYFSASIRGYSFEDRMNLIEYVSTVKDPGWIIIDQIGDLVVEYNDEKSARKLLEMIDRIQTRTNCLMILVVHTNRGGEETMGVLGSMFDKKASSVFILQKEKGRNAPTVARHKKGRDGEIHSIKFTHNEHGYPRFLGMVYDTGFEF